MIIGTGIDIVEVDRIAGLLSKENGIREKIFSQQEIEYCNSKSKSAEHFAARFAAKEAFLKAIGQGLNAGFDLFNIIIRIEAGGNPVMVLQGDFERMAKEGHWHKVHVSMSHTSSMACATVTIEG